MAFNLSSLKGLFSKLKPAAKAVAPVADDIAKGVVNYGDDAAKLVTNYGDDALNVANKVDDFVPDRTFEFTNPFGQAVSADYSKPGVWNIDGKTFHDVPENSLLTNQNVLKEELLNKRTGREYLNAVPREGSDVKFLGDATQLFDYDNREMFKRGDGFTITLPYHMPSEDLVYDYTTLRPHKNTALGRWYDEAMFEKMAKDSFLYNDPISPQFDLDAFYRGISFDDGTLPF